MIENKNKKFTLSNIAEFRPSEIADFLISRASREPWTLEEFGPEPGEKPLAAIASLYSQASIGERQLLAEGAVQALRKLKKSDHSDRTQIEVIDSVLTLAATCVPSIKFKSLVGVENTFASWVSPNSLPLSQRAALAISALGTARGLAILDRFWTAHIEECWVLPILIDARSDLAPMNALELSPILLEESISYTSEEVQIVIRASMQDAMVRMLELDFSDGLSRIIETLVQWPTHVRKTGVELLDELKPKFPFVALDNAIRIVESEADEANRAAPHQAFSTYYSQVAPLVPHLLTPTYEDQVYQKTLAYFSNLSPDHIDEVWPLICGVLESSAKNVEVGNRLLSVITQAVVEAQIPLKNLARLQSNYFERLGASRSMTDHRQNIISKLEDTVSRWSKPRKASVPKTLRISRAQYAEDLYLELLCIVLKCVFSDTDIKLVSGIPWHEIDTALIENEVDIALNNDDLFSYDNEWNGTEEIMRSSGAPLYRISGFRAVTSRKFLAGRGIKIPDSERWGLLKSSTETLLGSLEAPNEQLLELLSDAVIAVPEKMILHSVLTWHLEKHGIESNIIPMGGPDAALKQFLGGNVDIMLGGIIHTEYALARWYSSVPLFSLNEQVEGRLFATAQFYDEYPQFMKKLIEVVEVVRTLWEHPESRGFKQQFEQYCVNHINLGMKQSEPDGLATVFNIDELRSVLAKSSLLQDRSPKRGWGRKTSAKLGRTVRQAGVPTSSNANSARKTSTADVVQLRANDKSKRR